MSGFTETTRIDAPMGAVWRVLDDIGRIADWHPGLIGSEMVGDAPRGPDAERRCTISTRHWLEERVVEHAPPHVITFRVMRSTLPFEAADIRFRLEPTEDHTLVSVSPAYRLRYGLVGRMLDTVAVRASYRKAMRGLLSGLKRRVESERPDAADDDESRSDPGTPHG